MLTYIRIQNSILLVSVVEKVFNANKYKEIETDKSVKSQLRIATVRSDSVLSTLYNFISVVSWRI